MTTPDLPFLAARIDEPALVERGRLYLLLRGEDDDPWGPDGLSGDLAERMDGRIATVTPLVIGLRGSSDLELVDLSIQVWSAPPGPDDVADSVEWVPATGDRRLTWWWPEGETGLSSLRLPTWRDLESTSFWRTPREERQVDVADSDSADVGVGGDDPWVERWRVTVEVDGSDDRQRWTVRMWPGERHPDGVDGASGATTAAPRWGAFRMLSLTEPFMLEYGQILLVLDDDSTPLLESTEGGGALVAAHPDGLVLREQSTVVNDEVDVTIEVWTGEPAEQPGTHVAVVSWRPRNTTGTVTLGSLSGMAGTSVVRLPAWLDLRNLCIRRWWERAPEGDLSGPGLSPPPDGSPVTWTVRAVLDESGERHHWLVQLWPQDAVSTVSGRSDAGRVFPAEKSSTRMAWGEDGAGSVMCHSCHRSPERCLLQSVTFE